MTSQGILDVTDIDTVSNEGSIYSKGKSTITSRVFTNTGDFSSDGDMTVTVGTGGVDNSGTLHSTWHLSVTSQTDIQNKGEIKSYQQATLYADGQFINSGKIESNGNAVLKSNDGITIKGNKVNFSIKDEVVNVFGEKSLVKNGEMKMLSNESIKINNLNGNFELIGKKSELITDQVYITGDNIKGNYIQVNGVNEIQTLVATDKKIANFKTDDIDMYALKAVFNKANNIIELFDEVIVIRGGETIIGDYAIVNTLDKSYKVYSEKTKKVKILIEKTSE